MTIPFLSYFTRGKRAAVPKEGPVVAPKPALPPLEKPSSERFSKTVMPNATRAIAPQDPFEMAARSTALGGANGLATAVAPASVASRTISFGAPLPAAQRDLPPAVALALEPTVERVISLDLADVLAEMPVGYVKPIESIDGSRRILLKASEVERGMANGKPAVSLATIYEQVPEIFLRTVTPSDATQLKLPFGKVLDQFTSLQVRADQERARAVPQVETPFLKVTLEDNALFGTTMEPLETGDLPPVRVQPATAEAYADAEPEPATEAKLPMPIPTAQPARDNHTPSPARIPFKLSPNGTDVPAPESVPASSGPSVPISLPSAPAPVRIPFKMSPPSDDLRPKSEPWLTAETLAASAELAAPLAPIVPAPPPVAAEVKIALVLKTILRELPPMQWSGDAASVPEAARIEFPFALIEPQLATGRISVTAKVFQACLPPEYRSHFNADDAIPDVSLPLPEVLKNLPTTSLRMRDDQVEQEAGANFATPFSAKAEEDAKRLNVSAGPVAKPVVPAPVEEVSQPIVVATEAGPVEPVVEKASDRPPRTPLQVALDTDEKLDAKAIVALVNNIPGVKACAIMFGDGLSLAGGLPAEIETEGLCAMAPALMQRIENHLVDTKLGALRGMTLSCTKGAITFYMHENLCLGALHSAVDLPTETREKLTRVVHELSRKYSHPV